MLAMKRLLEAALMLALMPASVAICQPPALNFAIPAGVAPGKATDVVFHGGNLAGASGVWTSFPSQAELTPSLEGNGKQPASVSFRLTVPADAPLGVGGIRVTGPGGVSNLRLVLVDDLPSVNDAGNNKTLETAQAITPPVAIDGAADGEASDFYKFTAAAGQRISVEVFARRLGSPLDPMIRLLSADGHELAFSDDEPTTGADCRFSHKFAAAGDYYLEIRDIRYQGGGTHRYRVRVGDFPLASVPYPLAAQKGASASVQVAGKGVELPAPMAVTMPPEVPAGRLNVAASYAPGQGSSWFTLLATDAPEQLEVEPNDAPEQSTPVKFPGAIEGRFETPGDRDFYQFEAKKGERYVFAGQTRALGSPSDLFMRLYNAEGGVIAEAEDNGNEEGSLNATFPADGIYRLRVEDTNRRGGLDEVYRVVVEPYHAGFTLAAAAEKVDAPQNGVFVVKVTAARRDYNGPITLGVEGAGEGCTVRNNIIPEGKPEATMSVTIGPSLSAGQLAQIRIFGTAKIGESEFRAAASTLTALRAALSGLPFPPAGLDHDLALGVGPVFPKFFELAAASPLVPLVETAKPASATVQLARSNGFQDKVDVTVDGLPAGVTAKPVAIDKGKADAAIEFSSAQPIAPGKHKVRVIGSATFQNQPQQFVLDTLVLEGPPIAVSFAPAGPLAVGGKQKGVLTFAGDVSPVAASATYESGVTRGAEGPRACAGRLRGRQQGGQLLGHRQSAGRRSALGRAAHRHDGRLHARVLAVQHPRSVAAELAGHLRLRLQSPRHALGGQRPAGRPPGHRRRRKLAPRQAVLLQRRRTGLGPHHAGDEHLASRGPGPLGRRRESVSRRRSRHAGNPIHRRQELRHEQGRVRHAGRRFRAVPGASRRSRGLRRAARAAQVQAHFNAAKAMTPARDVILKDNPLVYWRLDETEGQVANSAAPAHKRLVKLAWKNLPAGLTAPGEVVLVDGQATSEIELAAAPAVAPAKLENVVVAATTLAGAKSFTADSPPAVLEVNKP